MSKPPVEILYEDNHLLIVNKPCGILTQPSGTRQVNVENLLKKWIKERDHKPGNVFLQAVHRLDKQVSGIVVFAKTQKAVSRMGEEIRSRKMQKTYLALTENCPEPLQGCLEHELLHDDHKAILAPKSRQGAKKAKLHYRILKKTPYILWEIVLETGRYHQIRAQLACIGCPIIGDYKYGSSKTLPNGCIALHHSSLEFIHPVQKIEISIYSEAFFNISH